MSDNIFQSLLFQNTVLLLFHRDKLCCSINWLSSIDKLSTSLNMVCLHYHQLCLPVMAHSPQVVESRRIARTSLIYMRTEGGGRSKEICERSGSRKGTVGASLPRTDCCEQDREAEWRQTIVLVVLVYKRIVCGVLKHCGYRTSRRQSANLRARPACGLTIGRK